MVIRTTDANKDYVESRSKVLLSGSTTHLAPSPLFFACLCVGVWGTALPLLKWAYGGVEGELGELASWSVAFGCMQGNSLSGAPAHRVCAEADGGWSQRIAVRALARKAHGRDPGIGRTGHGHRQWGCMDISLRW